MNNPLPKILAEQVAVLWEELYKQYGYTRVENPDKITAIITEAYRAGAEAHWEAVKPDPDDAFGWNVGGVRSRQNVKGDSAQEVGYDICLTDVIKTSSTAHQAFLADISKDGAITP